MEKPKPETKLTSPLVGQWLGSLRGWKKKTDANTEQGKKVIQTVSKNIEIQKRGSGMENLPSPTQTTSIGIPIAPMVCCVRPWTFLPPRESRGGGEPGHEGEGVGGLVVGLPHPLDVRLLRLRPRLQQMARP